MINKGYTRSFRDFSLHTNEKFILAEQIVRLGTIVPGSRVLDIGAGEGGIAQHLQHFGAIVEAVEPNQEFLSHLKNRSSYVWPTTWQKADPPHDFSVVIAVHAVTYFDQDELRPLIDKMIACTALGGKVIIITVDQNLGSWREIHEFFYQLNNIRKRKTSRILADLLDQYHPDMYSVTTNVTTPSIEAMVNILSFDFLDYPQQFAATRGLLHQHLAQYYKNDQIRLEVQHQILVLQK